MQESKYMKYHLLKTFSGVENYALAILSFFAPIKGIFVTVTLFIILDTFMGVWKAKNMGVPITSRGLSAVISKMLLYQALVLTTFCLDTFIIGDIVESIFSVEHLPTKIISVVLVYIEMKSVDENYKEVKGVSILKEAKNLITRAKEVKQDINELTKK